MLLHQLYPNVELADLSFDHREPFAKMRELEFKKIPVQEDSNPWKE
jgi:hypothetical protein